jgi:hypothetical protein
MLSQNEEVSIIKRIYNTSITIPKILQDLLLEPISQPIIVGGILGTPTMTIADSVEFHISANPKCTKKPPTIKTVINPGPSNRASSSSKSIEP